jgi:hypothetical protein
MQPAQKHGMAPGLAGHVLPDEVDLIEDMVQFMFQNQGEEREVGGVFAGVVRIADEDLDAYGKGDHASLKLPA